MRHLVELLLYKTAAELRAGSAQGFLGILWWVVEPVIYMAVFYVVFGVLLQRGGGPEYVPFLLIGLSVFKWFSTSVISGSLSIRTAAGLINLVYLPKFILPTTQLLVNMVKFFIIMFFLILFLLWFGFRPTLAWTAIPALVVAQFAFTLAVCLFTSALVPLVPDLKMLIERLMMLLFFSSGIFFDVHKLPEHVRPYFLLNPMAFFIDAFRKILMQGIWPAWPTYFLILFVALVGCGLGLLLLKRLDGRFAKLVH